MSISEFVQIFLSICGGVSIVGGAADTMTITANVGENVTVWGGTAQMTAE